MKQSQVASVLGNIKAIFTDVDGVLTDGRVALDDSGEELRSYHLRDRACLEMCHDAGIKLVMITSSSNQGIKALGRKLCFEDEDICLGVKNKTEEFEKQAQKLGLDHAQIAYIGDDLIDIGPMRLAGLACTVIDADPAVKEHANYIAKLHGGSGAVHEISEMLLKSQAPELFSLAMEKKRAASAPENIKAIFTNVDGVLTDGRISLGAAGESQRSYHVRDGIGLKMCQREGMKLVLITASNNAGIKVRGERLGFDSICMGVARKIDVFAQQAQELGLDHDQIAYIGGELTDIDPMRLAGLACTVADANPVIAGHADYIATLSGGNAAVREICEMLLKAHPPRLLADARSCGLSL